jgi:chemotaxis signal transduction protein
VRDDDAKMTTTNAREVLEARARHLARPVGAAENGVVLDANTLTVLIARLGEERVAFPLAQIVEVHRPSALSVVPGASAPVAGVIAWRGRVLTVLDLAHGRQGLPALGDEARVIVIGQARAAFGVFADETEDVQTIDLSTLVTDDDASPTRAAIVRGVTSDAVVVLDSIALLDRHTTPP